ncbi:opioid growth factor receptor-like isoform X1 [Takifugu rubripes]|uniref:opioid growth factor receptor-like isoform X1 n=1 Tax=Takifugu rubripes TaxID=31033 RepID=UPI0005D1FC48|nr:opioid growth factor receptor-like isoform X1 [Takifugu rubripes]|eukprot:XP_011612606.1 PREDICTED: opioid growth factor receptor-like isoform X1 [Takifugu rubripes]
MAWKGYRRFSSLFEWLWRKLLFLRPYFAPALYFAIGYMVKAISWRKGSRGGQDEGQERPGERDHEAAAGGGEFDHNDGETEPSEISTYGVCQEEQENSDEYRVESVDEFYCCYDSTWETDEGTSQTQWLPSTSRNYNFKRFENAAKDMQNYRHDYPRKPHQWRNRSSDEMPNLKFYCGLQHSEPDGIYIHTFHTEWFGRYDKLEYVHTYIQWLFPLQEPGMNAQAPPLTKREIKAFLENHTAKKNLLESYKLMLDFYGIQLESETTGRVKRAPNWAERFENLNMNTHNNLRITRILKCLGKLGYPHYQAPLVRFFLEETLVHHTLPNVKNSALNYFLFAVLDKNQRRELVKFAYSSYDCRDEFVWCPKKLQTLWSQPSRLKIK